MKLRSLVNLSLALLIAAAVNAAIVGTAETASTPASPAAALNAPTIISIHLEGTNVAVTAQIPAGVNVVTLEGRTRVGAGGWVPRAVLHLDGAGGEVTFRAVRSGNLELLRVRSEATATLPGSFYQGTKTFAGRPADGPVGPPVFTAAGDATRAGSCAGGRQSHRCRNPTFGKLRTTRFISSISRPASHRCSSPDKPAVSGTSNSRRRMMYLLDNNVSCSPAKAAGMPMVR